MYHITGDFVSWDSTLRVDHVIVSQLNKICINEGKLTSDCVRTKNKKYHNFPHDICSCAYIQSVQSSKFYKMKNVDLLILVLAIINYGISGAFFY